MKKREEFHQVTGTVERRKDRKSHLPINNWVDDTGWSREGSEETITQNTRASQN